MSLLAFALGFASAAQAVPIASGTVIIEEDDGFPGLCDAPCFRVQKDVEVWAPDDPDNPLPLAGNNTYLYTLTHLGGSSAFVPAITLFELEVDGSQVTAAGAVAGPGTAPDSTVVNPTLIQWNFNPTALFNGAMSQQLFIHSPLLPGDLDDNIISVDGQLSLDAPGACVGPLIEPSNECALQIDKEGCVVQEPEVPGDACDGKAKSITIQYTGTGCPGSSNLQSPWAQDCSDNDALIGSEPVDVKVYSYERVCKRRRGNWGWWGRRHCRWEKVIWATATGVNIGDEIVVDAAAIGRHKLPYKLRVKIRLPDGTFVEWDKFKTDCREPLAPGHQFGSWLITSLTSSQGGTVGLPDDEPDECVTNIEVAPPPHCVGKIEELQIRYVGGDCSQTNFDQWGNVTCVDPGTPTADPVRILITDGPPNGNVLLDETGVVAGDILTINAASLGLSHLPWEVGYWIKRADDGTILQDGSFLSKCQEPLNLGDQVGALQIFGIDTTQGGAVALGQEVEYTYKVTNPNDEAVTVDVDDDQLGNIVTGAVIPAGEMATFMTTAIIEETTTNVATVTGTGGSGQQCTEASDDATITVEHPDPPVICTTKVESVRLRYTGPTAYGVQLKVKAANFWNDPVDYGTIDLISGVTELTLDGGWTIDASAHGATALGYKILIWSSEHGDEKIDTTCCTQNPFSTNAQAPSLDGGQGAPNPNWFVVDFNQTN